MNKQNTLSVAALLSQLPLFQPLSDLEREHLAKDVVVRSFAKGETLLREGMSANGMYIVLDGVVKVIRLTPDGREVVLHLVRKGNMLGEASVFQQGTFPASAVAVGDVESLFIPAESLIRLIRENAELALRLLAALSLRLRMFSHKLAAQGQSGVPGRLAAYLLHRSQLNGNEPFVRLEVSREVLANLLGIARETLSRQLSRFAELGAVQLRGRNILLTNRELLESFAAGIIVGQYPPTEKKREPPSGEGGSSPEKKSRSCFRK